jgi:16S rRNA (guanine966-N2)-methyltransferase
MGMDQLRINYPQPALTFYIFRYILKADWQVFTALATRQGSDLRVIAGQYRSRPLRSLRGLEIRPTSDRLREALFNVLTAGNPSALEGSIWLDLYAGTGAVGIEALSRGAAKVYFVEVSSAAVKIIHENLKSLPITSCVEVIQADVGKVLRRLQRDRFNPDLVFLDPPYRLEHAYHDTLNLVGQASWLKTTTIVIVEHLKKFDPGETFASLARFRRLHQGDASLSFYRLAKCLESGGDPRARRMG